MSSCCKTSSAVAGSASSGGDGPDPTLLRVSGLWCTSCARAVEKVLLRQDGVTSARVNFTTGTAVVEGPPRDVEAWIDEIHKLGYRGEAWTATPGLPSAPPARTATHVRTALSVVLGMWVMMLQLTLYLGEADPATDRLLAAGAGALATVVVWVGGWNFHAAAWRTLRARVPGMDVLVSAGSLAAWSLSLVALLRGHPREVWFDTSVMLVVFLGLGRTLDAWIRKRGLDTLRALARPEPTQVWIVRGESVESVPPTSLRPGHVVRCDGDLGVDGVVERGQGAVDTSALTGEPDPVPVGPGDLVHAGTCLVEGRLDVRVTGARGDRRVDAIARRIQAALDGRTELQSVAERFAERLVPVVAVLAGLTGLGVLVATGDLQEAGARAVAVLVVTCPCALGVAAPMALAVAVGTAARHGLIFRNADALERAARITDIIFDKTGTLTTARPHLVEVGVAPRAAATGTTEDEVLSLAAAAEWAMAHPLAVILRQAARDRGLSLAREGEREAVPGQGVRWLRERGNEVRVGRPPWALESPEGGTDLPPGAFVVAESGALVGWFRTETPLREGASQVVGSLRRRGIEVHLASGDTPERARAVAEAVGIEAAEGGLGPEDKADRVVTLREAGRKVAFAGDGVNDAPSLAEADLGMAVEGSADAALAAAPVAIQAGGLASVERALVLGRRTLAVLRQNLVWAVGYNLAAVPLAALGIVGPEVAALAMVGSSVSVTLNALRLRRIG